jgi:hypothetical protein
MADASEARSPTGSDTAYEVEHRMTISTTRYETIEKPVGDLRLVPNLLDDAEERASFSWQRAREELAGLPRGRGLNMAHEAVDRHVALGRGRHLALRWLGKNGQTRDLTYQASVRATASPRSWRACSSCTSLSGHTRERQRVFAALLGVRTRAHRAARESRPGQGARHHGGVVRTQGRRDPRCVAVSRAKARAARLSAKRLTFLDR